MGFQLALSSWEEEVLKRRLSQDRLSGCSGEPRDVYGYTLGKGGSEPGRCINFILSARLQLYHYLFFPPRPRFVSVSSSFLCHPTPLSCIPPALDFPFPSFFFAGTHSVKRIFFKNLCHWSRDKTVMGETELSNNFLHVWCACLFTCMGTYVFRYMWKSEIDVRCLIQQLSTLFLETGSVVQPRAHQFV